MGGDVRRWGVISRSATTRAAAGVARARRASASISSASAMACTSAGESRPPRPARRRSYQPRASRKLRDDGVLAESPVIGSFPQSVGERRSGSTHRRAIWARCVNGDCGAASWSPWLGKYLGVPRGAIVSISDRRRAGDQRCAPGLRDAHRDACRKQTRVLESPSRAPRTQLRQLGLALSFMIRPSRGRRPRSPAPGADHIARKRYP